MSIATLAGIYVNISARLGLLRRLASRFLSWLSSFWCKSAPDQTTPPSTGDDNISNLSPTVETVSNGPPWDEIFSTPQWNDFSDIPADWFMALEPLYENKISCDTVLFLAQYSYESNPCRLELLRKQWDHNAARLRAAIKIQRLVKKFLAAKRAVRSRALAKCLHIAMAVDSYFASENNRLREVKHPLSYMDLKAKIIQKNYKIYKIRKNSIKEGKRKEMPILNTAFPRLGAEHLDGCDCWLPDPSCDSTLHRGMLITLFGKHSFSPLPLLGSPESWLLRRTHNQEALVIIRQDSTYLFYEATDCHLIEGVSSRMAGHQFKEKAVLRVDNLGDVLVLSYHPNKHTLDLSGDLEDQHLHLKNVRAFVSCPTEPIRLAARLPNNIRSDDRDELVLCGDVLMTRAEKRAFKKQEKQVRKQTGAKKPQIPARFQGLTTQEYHESRLREQEDVMAWVEERGRKALPQDVKDYLKSASGSKQWNDIHNFAVSRRAFALDQLSRLNRFLSQSKGLKAPLVLNETLIKNIENRNKQRQALREKQVKAAAERAPSAVIAREDWLTKTKEKRDTDILSYREKAEKLHWADLEDDDSLPDPTFAYLTKIEQ